MTASAEIIPGLTPKQEKQLFYASLQVNPPLTPDQQQQLLFAVSEIFPPSSGPRLGRRTIKEIEEMTRSFEEEEYEMEAVYKYSRKQQETVFLSAFTSIKPPLSTKQQHQLLTVSMEILV